MIDYTRRDRSNKPAPPADPPVDEKVPVGEPTSPVVAPGRINYVKPSAAAPAAVAPETKPVTSKGIDYRRSRFDRSRRGVEATHEHWLPEPLAPQRREVDGIPTFWVPGTGLTTAAVTFRVGRADEPLTLGGISHLVEHLSLFKLGQQPHYFNGGVEAFFTSFIVRGTPSEVVSFFARLAEALVNLPLGRLHDEKSIIDTEATSRGISLFQILREIRYGATGLGASNYREYAIHTATDADLNDWRLRYFHRDNAAISISGPFPKSLTFAMPGGQPRPVQPQPLLKRPFPTQSYGSDTLVALGLTAPPSTALKIAGAVGSNRGLRRLRYDQALSYTVAFTGEQEGAAAGELIGVADVLPGKAAKVVDGMVDLFEDLATNPPTVREMNEYREQVAASYFDADSGRELATLAARRHLLSEPLRTWDETSQLLDSVSPEDVSQVVSRHIDTAIMIVPPQVGKDESRFYDADLWTTAPISGQPLRLTDEALEQEPNLIIVLGSDGISLSSSPIRNTVRFSECCALLVLPGGGLHLIGEDGQHVRIVPGTLKDAHYVTTTVEAAIPASRRVYL